MRKIATFFFLSMLMSAFAYSQFHIGATWTPKLTTTSPDSAYFGDIGIRGAWVAPDLDQDGKPEIIVTDYTKSGRVHVFQSAGNDTLEWIWSSPRLDLVDNMGAGGSSTPRTIRTGDLDGDGKGEIIFARAGKGFLVFEWDGVPGSHKFGTLPSAIVPLDVPYGSNYGDLAAAPNEGGLQTTVEHFEVMDVDKDGKDELIIPKNISGSANDDFLIISADGEWDYENQGFASFKIEGSTNRLASVKYGGGSPYSVHPADIDGDGKYELVCHNWQEGDYFVMKATGADTYQLPDTNKTANFLNITSPYDQVALFGGIVGDIDKDGNDEVFFAWFDDLAGAGGGEEMGNLWIVNYSPNDDVFKADSTHVARIMTGISQSSSGERISSFNGVVADFDGNGKKEVIVSSSYPSNVVAAEYQGGNVMDPASYIRKVYYAGEKDIYAAVTYSDSLGVKDTLRTIGEGFVSKMAGPVDLDGDGKFELLLPYQSLIDTATYSWRHYVADSAKFITDSTKKRTNPKKWAIRSLERDIAGSVRSKEYVMITPDNYILNQNYPNPFNPSTQINFVLPLNKKVSLKVYDMLGKEVRTLINNEEYAKGNYNVTWNGRDNSGRTVASGTYIAKMVSGNIEKSIKMMMVK